MGRSGVVVIVAVLIALFVFARHSPDPPANGQDPPAFGGSGSVSAHLNVVPTIRSVTVSPGSATFGDCTGGVGATASTSGKMGYPNGICWVGSTGPNSSFPITITYTGLPGSVWVSGSSAVPSDHGTSWSLCNPVGQPACTGGQGKPGKDQFAVSTFGAEVANFAVLTGSASCDIEFNPGGGCSATPVQFSSQAQHEGIQLTGPKTWDDGSTSWSVSITWIAESPD
ncbi:MAG: hypothetical protein ACRDOH_17965 [Streptosporangiaceae bacterium]